jgi:hypothetical protein
MDRSRATGPRGRVCPGAKGGPGGADRGWSGPEVEWAGVEWAGGGAGRWRRYSFAPGGGAPGGGAPGGGAPGGGCALARRRPRAGRGLRAGWRPAGPGRRPAGPGLLGRRRLDAVGLHEADDEDHYQYGQPGQDEQHAAHDAGHQATPEAVAKREIAAGREVGRAGGLDREPAGVSDLEGQDRAALMRPVAVGERAAVGRQAPHGSARRGGRYPDLEGGNLPGLRARPLVIDHVPAGVVQTDLPARRDRHPGEGVDVREHRG